jgi:hypothetical protein
MAWGTNQRLVAAVFVDFDNFYSALRNEDFEAANAFAVAPQGWVRWLENGLPGKIDNGQNREVALRHCYINPRQFGRFTQPFQRAGFQLVDCLTLNDQGTTTAQMVMGLFDAFANSAGVGEFVVVTSKPDFAPVLDRLRKVRRRTVAITSDEAAACYKNSCDVVVTTREFTTLSLRSIRLPDDPDVALGPAPMPVSREESGRRAAARVQPASITDVKNFLSELVTRSPTAVSIEYLIHQVWTSRLAADLQLSNWAGFGDCANLVRNHIKELRLVERNGYVYDPDIHPAPAAPGRRQ